MRPSTSIGYLARVSRSASTELPSEGLGHGSVQGKSSAESRGRNGLRRIVDTTPWHWFAYFHGLRIAALGTAYKTLIGEFPVYFEIFVGIPDLLFGVSAFWIARKAKHGKISKKGFLFWNLLGALVNPRRFETRMGCCSFLSRTLVTHLSSAVRRLWWTPGAVQTGG